MDHNRGKPDRPPEAESGHAAVPPGTLQGAGDSSEVELVPKAPGSPPPPPAPSATVRHAPGQAAPLDILPADLEYRLVRLLGRGNYGEVYEALAPGGFRVAVKRIMRGVDHPESKAELESLEAIKTVSHPFLLQTQAYWVFRDQLVIVMDLAEGTLHDRVQACKQAGRDGLPPGELVPYFEQAAEALDYLHGLNISHRDIKPQNLLYLKGYAKVADFGLARVHEHAQTSVGSVTGTPWYMAPEMWNRKVSLHSDQYSLAATYVMARLGRPVFGKQLTHELALAHLLEEPNLDPLPAAEQAVLKRALAKKPEDRYPDCRAFAKALREAVFPPPPPAPAKSPWLARALIALAVSAVIVAGFFAFGPLLRQWGGTPVVQPDSPWKPADWEPDGAELTDPDLGGKRYYKRLARTVGGERIVAVAVTKAKPNDPPTFYMLRDKVTNRVFEAVWDAQTADPKSQVSRLRHDAPERAADLLPEAWRKGAVDRNGADLKTDGEQAGVPVVGVTVPEAVLVAEALGGKLPTFAQWSKAVGAGEDTRAGPAGDDPVGLAIDLPRGPLPVGRPTPDLSVHGVHQLTSNGSEWTRDADRQLSLFPPPPIGPKVRRVGRSWDAKSPLTFADLAREAPSTLNWDNVTEGVGFRVVLEPE